ncbi:MAG TPA: alpha/beta hydrolase fold domain-containing protein [Polyangiaceae bacterium]|jgi:acetyl esterase/lipase|nr:alpha/beta hydrolase fold domain-containing protein [Polyangiaceae bacterium]
MDNHLVTHHPLAPADVAPRAAIRTLLEPLREQWPDWPERRASFNDLIAAVSAVPGVEYEAASVGGVPGFWCRPPDARPGAALLYFHGGAYVVGSPRAHRGFVSQIAARARVATFIPQYRLAPEHRFPAAVHDARACYRALRDDTAGPIAIAGASAGGGLGLILLALASQDAAKAGHEPPAGAALLSPWTDLSLSGESMHTRAQADVALSARALSAAANHYLAGHDPRDPLASPLYAELAGLPPIRIHVGDDEVLLDDSLRFVERALAAGVDVRLDIWEGMLHVFPISVGRLRAAAQALDAVGAFLAQRLER